MPSADLAEIQPDRSRLDPATQPTSHAMEQRKQGALAQIADLLGCQLEELTTANPNSHFAQTAELLRLWSDLDAPRRGIVIEYVRRVLHEN